MSSGQLGEPESQRDLPRRRLASKSFRVVTSFELTFHQTPRFRVSSLANPSGITSHRYINTMTTAVPPSGRSTTQVPDFSPYLHKNPSTNRTLQYFMVGSLGLLAASGAKSTVTDILANMSASADVLALAKIEVEMSAIPEGKWVLPVAWVMV
jgi:hypothetical protein